jgi:hypothetical protein
LTRTPRLIAALWSLIRRLFRRGRRVDPTRSQIDAPVPLLTYALGTEPLPLQASPATGTPPHSTLTLLATNGTGAAVALQALQVTLPIGAEADDLTESAPPAWAVPAGWTQKALNQAAGQAVYTFEPTQGGGGSVAAEQALLFVLNGVQVNAQAGTFQLQVTEGSGGCIPPDCPLQSIPVTKVPSGSSVVSFWATPAVVSPGGSTELGWRGPPGATYTISWFDPQQGQVTVPAQGQPALAYDGAYPGASDPPLKLVETTYFTLNVSMAAGGESWSGQQQVAVVVGIPAPTITSLTAVLSGPAATPSVTVAWSAENALSCQLAGVSELLAPSGSHTFAWPLAKSYTLTATGPNLLTTTRTVSTPPAIASFAGTCALGASGVTLTLSWDALLADSCTIAGVAGTFPAPAGSATLMPSAASPLVSTYTLTAANGTATSTATAGVRWGPGAGSVYATGGIGALSPDGTCLYLWSQAGMLPLSIPQLQPRADPVVLSDVVIPLAMAATGDRLLVVGMSATLMAYDAATLSLLAGPAGTEAWAICVSPDAEQVFVACFGAPPTVSIVDVATLAPQGAPLASSGTDNTPYSVVVSPDGSRLYLGVSPVHAWSREADSAWTPAETCEAGAGHQKLALSPDGGRLYVLCSGDDTLWALDAHTLQPLLPALTLSVPLPSVDYWPTLLTLAVSGDGSLLFVGCTTSPDSTSGTVLVVDSFTLQQVGEIDGFDGWLASLAFTPDGATLVATTLWGSTHVIPPAGYST